MKKNSLTEETSFIQSEAQFCLNYPQGWTAIEFFQDGKGVVLLDPIAVSEGVTEHNTDSLRAGAYLTIGQETILPEQADLSVFTADGWLANSLGNGTFRVRQKKMIMVDGQKGILAKIDPHIVNGQIPQGAASYYRLDAFVRDGNTYYTFGSFFATEQARTTFKPQFKGILHSLKFPQHCV